jgi:glutathione S-transferase
MLVPSLQHNGVKVWDTLAIGEYLNEIKPKAGCCQPTSGACALPGHLRRDAFGLQHHCAARCR